MSMTPSELEALMGEPDDTSTATTMTAAPETPEERKARIIHDMAMMDAAFERYGRAHGVDLQPSPSRGPEGDRAA